MESIPPPTLHPECEISVIGQPCTVTVCLDDVLAFAVQGEIRVGRSLYRVDFKYPIDPDRHWHSNAGLRLWQQSEAAISDTTFGRHHKAVRSSIKIGLEAALSNPQWQAATETLCAFQELAPAMLDLACAKERASQHSARDRAQADWVRQRHEAYRRVVKVAEIGAAFPGHALRFALTLLEADASLTVSEMSPVVHDIYPSLAEPCPHGWGDTRAACALAGCLPCARHLGGVAVQRGDGPSSRSSARREDRRAQTVMPFDVAVGTGRPARCAGS